jgi:dTDP-4-amino-4,6-dideoxygalactose transaminase
MKLSYSEVLRGTPGVSCPRRTVYPPNRLETRNRDLLAAIPGLWSSNSLPALTDALRHLTGREQVFFAPSARAAIAHILSLLPQQEVVMPAFTCPVVKTAVQAAGKRIIYVDTAPNQLNSTSVQFEKHAKPGRVLLPTHLFGIPTDVERICALAKDRGCITIEDAAAVLGARYHGRQLGTFADFGVFSFERSKRFPAFRGGAIIVNNEGIIEASKLASGGFLGRSQRLPVREIVFSLMYNVATVPSVYGRLVLPRLLQRYAGWDPARNNHGGDDPLHTPFYTQRFQPFQATLVLRMLSRIDRIREHIRTLVSAYLKVLRGTNVLTPIPEDCDHAALLRFPVMLPEIERSHVLRHALQRGLFLETNYEQILAEEPPDGAFPHAQWASRNLVLLPLYGALSPENAMRLAEQIAAIEKEGTRESIV